MKDHCNDGKRVVDGEDLGEVLPSNLSANSQPEVSSPSPFSKEVASALMHTSPISELPSFAIPKNPVRKDGDIRFDSGVKGKPNEKKRKLVAVSETTPFLKDDIDDIFDSIA